MPRRARRGAGPTGERPEPTPARAAGSACGVLDAPAGEHGRLLSPDLRPRPDDPLVLRALMVRCGLRPGDVVEGELGPAPGGRGQALSAVTAVNGTDPAAALRRPRFEE